MTGCAIVARPRLESLEYLVERDGALQWANDPNEAATFDTIRAALQAATRLPSSFRAFALPIGATA